MFIPRWARTTLSRALLHTVRINQNHENVSVFCFESCGHLFYHGVVPLVFPLLLSPSPTTATAKDFPGPTTGKYPSRWSFRARCVIWIWLWVKTHHGATQHEPNHHHAWMLTWLLSLQPCHRLHKLSHNMFLLPFVFAHSYWWVSEDLCWRLYLCQDVCIWVTYLFAIICRFGHNLI